MKEGLNLKSKDINFEYIEEFVDYLVEKVESDEDLFLTVVGKYEEIKNIIKGMIIIADVDFEKINLYSSEVDDYVDEYALDCFCNDGVIQISCEAAKRDGKYLNLAGDETYLLDNCSSKIIPLCEGSSLYFVSIEDECDCEDECYAECPCDCHKDEYVEYSKTDDGKIHGFSASKSTENGYHSYSYLTNSVLSKNDVHSMLRELGF